MILDFIYHMNKSVEIKVYSDTRNKIIENLYRHTIDDIDIKLDLYLNKIESNNFPCEEIKHKLIIELINIVENNYDEIYYKILEYFKGERLINMRKVILSSITITNWGELRNSRLIRLLEIDDKSRSIIY